jgi:predicted nuclease with TOPRIM domain
MLLSTQVTLDGEIQQLKEENQSLRKSNLNFQCLIEDHRQELKNIMTRLELATSTWVDRRAKFVQELTRVQSSWDRREEDPENFGAVHCRGRGQGLYSSVSRESKRIEEVGGMKRSDAHSSEDYYGM